jgi:predicted aconitase with swiveling domain
LHPNWLSKNDVTVFTGRVVIKGEAAGPVLVSATGFNALASYHAVVDGNSLAAICSDAENPDLYGQNLQDKIICAPGSVGSTTAGPCWDRIAELGLAPRAMLFAGNIDSTTAGGLILAQVWRDTNIICIDRLGEAFLEQVRSAIKVQVTTDGQVCITASPGDSVFISKKPHHLTLLHPPGYSFYASCRDKLRWSNALVN